MSSTKICNGSLCLGQHTPISEFGPDASRRDGLAPRCRPCNRAYHQQWREAHPERPRAYKAARIEVAKLEKVRWRAENPDKDAIYSAKARATNPEREQAKASKYRQTHPEVGRAGSQRRRARIQQRPVEKFLDSEVFERDNWICGLCNEAIHREITDGPWRVELDHIVPISMGGSHTRSNVQAAHRICNRRKGNREKAS
jgi:5-methylcytosine-specific restriction endonuclease McrA